MIPTDLLTPSRIAVSRAGSKPALLAELSRSAGAALGLAPSAVTQALTAREALGSTGVGGGLALPHARLSGIAAPIGFFIRLERSIDWEAVDGRPVDLVFLLLSPAEEDAGHLAALAAMARRLRDPAVAARIRAAAADGLHAAVTG